MAFHPRKENKGLKRLRKGASSRQPAYHCSNCKCNRYSPCSCKRKHDNN